MATAMGDCVRLCVRVCVCVRVCFFCLFLRARECECECMCVRAREYARTDACVIVVARLLPGEQASSVVP